LFGINEINKMNIESV